MSVPHSYNFQPSSQKNSGWNETDKDVFSLEQVFFLLRMANYCSEKRRITSNAKPKNHIIHVQAKLPKHFG